ncbi:MAG: DUF1934 domain-containing protein [Clostridiales bacterium]|nr:DUF1934 domain-containing protein [Clostridiales bacterium]
MLLEITGTQRAGGQKDEIQLTTVGTVEELEDRYIIKYTEQHESPLSPTDVTLDILRDESSVEMTRNGAYPTRMIIERSKRNLCTYATEYGELLMGIAGHNIEIEVTDNGGKFVFCYDIDFNGALASRNEVEVKYTGN